jgi:hypothetical protein
MDKKTKRDLCINRNNHQKPTFHPLGDFLNPAFRAFFAFFINKGFFLETFA